MVTDSTLSDAVKERVVDEVSLFFFSPRHDKILFYIMVVYVMVLLSSGCKRVGQDFTQLHVVFDFNNCGLGVNA